MRVLLAADKFRGTATATQAVTAMASAAQALGHTTVSQPLADGGEGMLDVLGGANRVTTVSGPLGDAVEASWRLHRRVAVIEMAQASGLLLVGGADGNDAIAASTYGTGELISAALDGGAKSIIVGVGGSATTDGGLGALRALLPVERLRGITMTVACDVGVGFLDAARIFAPQKGATPRQVELLERRLERLVQVFLEDYGVDVSELEGAGAAGGLAGGLACIGASLQSGFDLIAEQVDLDEAVEAADVVLTGEGFLDEESFDGKVVGGVAAMAESFGVPVVAVVGESFDGAESRLPTVSLVRQFGRDRALNDTLACLGEAVPIALARVS